MVMTREEIRRDWEAAKDKKAQIGILADLNQTTEEEIIGILRAQGVDGRSLPFKPRAPKQKTELGQDKAVKEAKPAEPSTVSFPTVRPRRQHEAERMVELFTGIGAVITADGVPPLDWLDEFNDLWIKYATALLEGSNT